MNCNIKFTWYFQSYDTGHNLSKRSDLNSLLRIERCHYLVTMKQYPLSLNIFLTLLFFNQKFSIVFYFFCIHLVYYVSLSSNILRRIEWFSIIFIQLLFQLKNLPFLSLQILLILLLLHNMTRVYLPRRSQPQTISSYIVFKHQSLTPHRLPIFFYLLLCWTFIQTIICLTQPILRI